MSSKYEVPTTPCRNLFKLNLLGCWFTSKVLLKFALIFQLCNKRQQSLLQFALIFWQLVSELLEQRPGIPWLWSSMQLVKSSSGLEKSFRSAIMAFIYWFICLFLLLWCPGGDKENGMEWNGMEMPPEAAGGAAACVTQWLEVPWSQQHSTCEWFQDVWSPVLIHRNNSTQTQFWDPTHTLKVLPCLHSSYVP